MVGMAASFLVFGIHLAHVTARQLFHVTPRTFFRVLLRSFTRSLQALQLQSASNPHSDTVIGYLKDEARRREIVEADAKAESMRAAEGVEGGGLTRRASKAELFDEQVEQLLDGYDGAIDCLKNEQLRRDTSREEFPEYLCCRCFSRFIDAVASPLVALILLATGFGVFILCVELLKPAGLPRSRVPTVDGSQPQYAFGLGALSISMVYLACASTFRLFKRAGRRLDKVGIISAIVTEVVILVCGGLLYLITSSVIIGFVTIFGPFFALGTFMAYGLWLSADFELCRPGGCCCCLSAKAKQARAAQREARKRAKQNRASFQSDAKEKTRKDQKSEGKPKQKKEGRKSSTGSSKVLPEGPHSTTSVAWAGSETKREPEEKTSRASSDMATSDEDAVESAKKAQRLSRAGSFTAASFNHMKARPTVQASISETVAREHDDFYGNAVRNTMMTIWILLSLLSLVGFAVGVGLADSPTWVGPIVSTVVLLLMVTLIPIIEWFATLQRSALMITTLILAILLHIGLHVVLWILFRADVPPEGRDYPDSLLGSVFSFVLYPALVCIGVGLYKWWDDAWKAKKFSIILLVVGHIILIAAAIAGAFLFRAAIAVLLVAAGYLFFLTVVGLSIMWLAQNHHFSLPWRVVCIVLISLAVIGGLTATAIAWALGYYFNAILFFTLTYAAIVVILLAVSCLLLVYVCLPSWYSLCRESGFDLWSLSLSVLTSPRAPWPPGPSITQHSSSQSSASAPRRALSAPRTQVQQLYSLH